MLIPLRTREYPGAQNAIRRIRLLTQNLRFSALLIVAWVLAGLLPLQHMHVDSQPPGFSVALQSICGSATPVENGQGDAPTSGHPLDCPCCAACKLTAMAAWAPSRALPAWQGPASRPLVPDCVRLDPYPSLRARAVTVRGPPAAAHFS